MSTKKGEQQHWVRTMSQFYDRAWNTIAWGLITGELRRPQPDEPPPKRYIPPKPFPRLKRPPHTVPIPERERGERSPRGTRI